MKRKLAERLFANADANDLPVTLTFNALDSCHRFVETELRATQFEPAKDGFAFETWEERDAGWLFWATLVDARLDLPDTL